MIEDDQSSDEFADTSQQRDKGTKYLLRIIKNSQDNSQTAACIIAVPETKM